MPKKLLTQKGIEALIKSPPPSGRIEYSDTIARGLVLRVGATGAAWYFKRRIDGRLVRVKIGEWPTKSLKDARDRVGEIQEEIDDGKHPKASEARQRAEKSASRQIDKARLVENVVSAWKAHHLPDVMPQTRMIYERATGRLLDDFRGRDVTAISRADLLRLLDKTKERSKSGANHTAATVRLLFAYAYDRLGLENNPASGLKNPARLKPRDRILDRWEIRIVWRACLLAGYPWGHALRFQLCTGQRIGEVGNIHRSDVSDGYWRLSKNKRSKRIDVFIASHAAAILTDCPSFGDQAPYFSASTSKTSDGAVVHRGLRTDAFSHAMSRHIWPKLAIAAEQLGLPPITQHWTSHDLRRTVRSGLTGWAGVLPDIAERTINHAVGGIRAVYDHADYRPHVAKALKAWDAELIRILEGKPPHFEKDGVTPI